MAVNVKGKNWEIACDAPGCIRTHTVSLQDCDGSLPPGWLHNAHTGQRFCSPTCAECATHTPNPVTST